MNFYMAWDKRKRLPDSNDSIYTYNTKLCFNIVLNFIAFNHGGAQLERTHSN